MSAKIIPLGNVTRLDLPVDRVLESAKGKLEGVLIVGFEEGGQLYCASSYADGGVVMWLIEMAKLQLLRATCDLECDDE